MKIPGEQLKFLPGTIARFVDGEGLFVVSEHRSDVLIGDIFRKLAPLLEKGASIDAILDRTNRLYPEAQTIYALDLLARQGALGTADGLPLNDVMGPAPERLRRVSFVNSARLDLANLTALLARHEVVCARKGRQIVVTADYLDESIRSHNTRALASGEPWLLIRPVGKILWFGPVFVPGETGCWECLSARLRLNRRVLRFLESRLGEPMSFAPPRHHSAEAMGAAAACNEIVRWLDGDRELHGTLVTLDIANRKYETHAVIRLPNCPACGQKASAQPIGLERDASTTVSRDGGFRSSTATEVYERLKVHVSALTGVVTHLTPLETHHDQIHVYVAGQNLGATTGTLEVLSRTLRSRSSGKGISEIQAKTSALCESIERFATVFQGHERVEHGSLSEFSDQAIAPNNCMLFSDLQYRERETRNRTADLFSRVPKMFAPEARLWWSPVHSLFDSSRRLLPTAYLYFHSEELRDPVGIQTCMPDSNGVATGSTYNEALLQGVLELVERDAVALWWYPRTQVSQVDLASFGSSFLETCEAYHRQQERVLWVLDITTDLGIPVFAAVSRRVTAPQQIVLGFGAHVDARIAVERAVAEANQILAGVEARVVESEDTSDATMHWLRTATVEREAYLQPTPDRVSTASCYPAPPSTVVDALDRCLEAVRSAGLHAYALDLTRPGIDLKVVRVLVPGLRHFWARFAPGRLYNVPYTLGRVGSFLEERQLNPIGMFL